MGDLPQLIRIVFHQTGAFPLGKTYPEDIRLSSVEAPAEGLFSFKNRS